MTEFDLLAQELLEKAANDEKTNRSAINNLSIGFWKSTIRNTLLNYLEKLVKMNGVGKHLTAG